MEQIPTNRRRFLKGALAGGAVAVSVALPNTAQAESKLAAGAKASNLNPAYLFFNLNMHT